LARRNASSAGSGSASARRTIAAAYAAPFGMPPSLRATREPGAVPLRAWRRYSPTSLIADPKRRPSLRWQCAPSATRRRGAAVVLTHVRVGASSRQALVDAMHHALEWLVRGNSQAMPGGGVSPYRAMTSGSQAGRANGSP
jgi:hypothetical protein